MLLVTSRARSVGVGFGDGECEKTGSGCEQVYTGIKLFGSIYNNKRVMKTKVGAVTKSERDEIRRIYERRNGLIELFGILTPEKTEIYDRVVEDMGRTTARFQQW